MSTKPQSKKELSAQKFDELFLSGADMSKHVDWSQANRRINLDIPVWALKALDAESNRRGIARQALIKTWLIDKLDELSKREKNAV